MARSCRATTRRSGSASSPPPEATGANPLHLHLTSTTLDDQQRSVDVALGLGGRHLDVGQLPEEGHIVLADPEGNAFCVIGPDSSFLAGCGYLGEVACDGGREVGVFWSEALGWPLVWDQDEETAIQSPLGGTKVAWGGPPDSPKVTRDRQRFDLAAADLPTEVARLVALGATRLTERDGGVELADPGGHEFFVALGGDQELGRPDRQLLDVGGRRAWRSRSVTTAECRATHDQSRFEATLGQAPYAALAAAARRPPTPLRAAYRSEAECQLPRLSIT